MKYFVGFVSMKRIYISCEANDLIFSYVLDILKDLIFSDVLDILTHENDKQLI